MIYEALVTRGAKEPRSVYLGGRAEVRHLLLGGRVKKMTYKQRVQVEEEFCRCFPAEGEWKNLNECDRDLGISRDTGKGEIPRTSLGGQNATLVPALDGCRGLFY